MSTEEESYGKRLLGQISGYTSAETAHDSEHEEDIDDASEMPSASEYIDESSVVTNDDLEPIVAEGNPDPAIEGQENNVRTAEDDHQGFEQDPPSPAGDAVDTPIDGGEEPIPFEHPNPVPPIRTGLMHNKPLLIIIGVGAVVFAGMMMLILRGAHQRQGSAMQSIQPAQGQQAEKLAETMTRANKERPTGSLLPTLATPAGSSDSTLTLEAAPVEQKTPADTGTDPVSSTDAMVTRDLKAMQANDSGTAPAPAMGTTEASQTVKPGADSTQATSDDAQRQIAVLQAEIASLKQALARASSTEKQAAPEPALRGALPAPRASRDTAATAKSPGLEMQEMIQGVPGNARVNLVLTERTARPQINLTRLSSNLYELRVKNVRLKGNLPQALPPVESIRVGRSGRDLLFKFQAASPFSAIATIDPGRITVGFQKTVGEMYTSGRAPSLVHDTVASTSEYQIRAITPNAAVLVQSSSGHMISVEKGMVVPACGIVTVIDAANARIGTECGWIGR